MTESQLKIQSSCLIRDNQAFLNGEMVFTNEDGKVGKAFLKSLYRHLKPGHSKFFKMDSLSKLGYLASELLLKNVDLSSYDAENMSVILSNSDSTLDIDSEHQDMIRDYNKFYPSPSVFVYTLPNIMIGEISIKHGMRGENAFYIVEKFTPELIVDHINSLFLKHKSKLFVGGWVNSKNDEYEAFLYVASPHRGKPHNKIEIMKLYNT